ncbi:hypothetical protein P879_10584 [Paragonimus westermani]|uniref:Isochorismatase-like domain-containing protein n=1 Tax=Paragonimus westermani TaxID=34504 RepID=A0A8T0DBE3_9TREM|nr:hypothetical protein P879_10584 [Paragonimus westermani]
MADSKFTSVFMLLAASALDAAKLGYRVIVAEDACVGINHSEIRHKRQEMLEAGVHLTCVAKVIFIHLTLT